MYTIYMKFYYIVYIYALFIIHRPIRFKVEKTGDYWLCNCKQTKNRPFCDGTHKEPHIQAAIK